MRQHLADGDLVGAGVVQAEVGQVLDDGASRSTNPCSTSCITASAVMPLLVEPTPTGVSSVIRRPVARSAKP
jgi:hypothetical protein